MRHRTDQLACTVTRQLGIGVKCDDVFHLRQRLRVADNHGERVTRMAPQQRIQVTELASLALPSHPRALLRIPAARAMQQIKNIAWRFVLVTVGAIKRIDSIARDLQQRIVGR